MTLADKDGLVTLDELNAILRTHEGPLSPHPRPKPKRRLRLRWIAVPVAVALLAGSGLGFGLGSWITPSGSAGGDFVGVSLPALPGWTVVQSGKGSTGASSVVAANVPLELTPGTIPKQAVERLPSRGILIAAKFSPRGDPAVDLGFPLRRLPLRLADATPIPTEVPHVSLYRVRSAAGGYNIDAVIYFGRAQPSEIQQALAQRQLGLLIVGAARITLFARRLSPQQQLWGANGYYELYGSIESGKANEAITIQTRDCGQDDFRATAGTTSRDGGGWSWQYTPLINTTVHAVWKGEASNQIKLFQPARIGLAKYPSGRLYVSVGGQTSFWRKRVVIQRRQDGRWKTIETVVLTETRASKGVYAGSGAGAPVKVSVPKGTLLRAAISKREAGPCYLAGVSDSVRK